MDYEKFLSRQLLLADRGEIINVRSIYTHPNIDLEALKQNGYIDALAEMIQPLVENLDDHHPSNIAYWAKLGMVKEFHGEDVPMSWTEYAKDTGYLWQEPEGIPHRQNRFKFWISYVPVSAFDPKNAGRKYPLVIAMHGGFNPASMIDGWGYPQEAAKREWIVISPSIELDDVLDEIIAEAKTLYPIDESRIYATGFSYGGFMSNFLGNKRPDVYAAVAPCGAPISNGFVDKAAGPEPQSPFDGVPRCIEMGTYMPCMNVYGSLDGNRFPFYNAVNFRTGESVTATLIEGINSWARANRAPEIALEDVMALKDRTDISEEEKHIGLPLAEDCRRTVMADGITNYIADLKSEDGVARVRIMCEQGMPHWPTPEMARQIFEFFSHFSRDPETKESIYHP